MTAHVGAPLVQPVLVAESCCEPIKGEGRASVLIERGVVSTPEGAVGKGTAPSQGDVHQWLARNSRSSCSVLPPVAQL